MAKKNFGILNFKEEPQAPSGAKPNEAGDEQTSAQTGRKVIYELTQFGNAQYFSRLYRGRVKYVPELDLWLVWFQDRWVRCKKGKNSPLMRLVKAFLLVLFRNAKLEAQLFTTNGRPVSPAEVTKWAMKSSSNSAIKALLEILKGMPGVSISAAELDKLPDLLGVRNGVLDLAKGTLVPSNPAMLITRRARAAFDPKATCPTFMTFIDDICLGRKDLVAYLQAVLGYALSGHTTEQQVFVFVGAGANGKSTLIELIAYLLGRYAKGMPGHSFVKSESRAIRNDIARLPGIRFASAVEINTGRFLDEAMIKRLTGGDTVTARFISREFFDFHPVAKFFMGLNTLPLVKGADNGIYRRLVIIPFEADFRDREDKALLGKLKAEIDGILTWLLEGLTRMRERGHLVQPPCVTEACRAFRAQMDTVEAFLEEKCDRDPESATPLGALYEAYTEWAKASFADPANKHLFGILLEQKGFKKFKSGSWQWRGVALKKAPTTQSATFNGLGGAGSDQA